MHISYHEDHHGKIKDLNLVSESFEETRILTALLNAITRKGKIITSFQVNEEDEKITAFHFNKSKEDNDEEQPE